VEFSAANGQNLAVVEGRHRVVDETDQRAGISLAHNSASLSVARSFVASVLESWDREDPDNIVPLLTSEIVSNAVRHAAGRITLELVLDEEEVRVEVRDGAPAAPVVRRSNPGGIGGHGLTIVESLARSWGVERYEDHKVVWFEAPVSLLVR
jgi:anti-sigma regulatory factor (Ser/Thr protein kinase)